LLQTGLQFSLASSSEKPHLLEVSTTSSPLFDEEVVVVVEVEEVVVSGEVTGLLVGAAVVWLVG
jgi:hypothetical protein